MCKVCSVGSLGEKSSDTLATALFLELQQKKTDNLSRTLLHLEVPFFSKENVRIFTVSIAPVDAVRIETHAAN